MGTCSGCGAASREGAAFCPACGLSLTPPCPACGNPASPSDRFCDTCGTPLDDRSPALAAPAQQSRKVVTVLFADLSGSTAAQDGADPEAVRRTMDRYYAAMRTEIEGHGGRLVKFIGDGVMAAFGVPDVREDDARRALEAAVAMQAAYAGLVTAGVPGGLRIGINTGEVVVTERDDDVVGDAVNLAARLEQAASPSEILVGESTFRLVRLAAQLRAVPPLDVKGKAEPVKAFRLVSLDPVEDARAGAPFIGRATELNRLLAVLDDAVKSSGARLATIVGSPGVGKTRLAHELAATASDRARVVEVRCDPAVGATFAPIAEALRVAASLEEDADEGTVVAALTALLPEDEPDRERVATVAAALLGAGEPSQPEESFWAVRRLVENGARGRPMVLVFDDVHWAAPLLLDLIDNLAEWVRGAAVLVVLTARPELRDLRPSLVEEGGHMSAVIRLEGLDTDQSRRLALELLDTDWLPEELLDRLAQASEGNPLFVGELVRMLVDDGVLVKDGDEWTASVELAAIDVPVTIHALLGARLDRLRPDEQAFLEAASIIGKTFYRGVVAELAGPTVADALDDIVERLRRKELVEPSGTYWIDEPVYRFHHVLLRDAAYRRLLKDARADLHERAAVWMVAKVGELTEIDDVIGFQLEQAYALRTELGVPDREIGRRAAARLSAAGGRALEADDAVSAASLLGRALDCLGSDDATVPDLLVARCEALLSSGDLVGAQPVVERLHEVANGSERLEQWATCFAAEIATVTSTGSLLDTEAAAADAATRFQVLGDLAGEAKAHAVRAASLARLGRIGECEATLDRALGAARRAGDRRRATAVLDGAPVAALWGPNPVTRASGRCLDVVRVLRITHRAPVVEATSLRCQAVLEALRGRFEAARRMLGTARASLEELGDAPNLLQLGIAAGMVETLAAEHGAAEDHLRAARGGLLALGVDVDAALASALLADVLVRVGRVREALPLTEESERLGGDDLRAAIAWRAVRADALVSQGEVDAARRVAEEAVSLAESTDALLDHAKALASLARALRATGDEVGACARATTALELYERKEATVLADGVRSFLGQSDATSKRDVPGETIGAHVGTNAAVRIREAVVDAVVAGDVGSVRALLAPSIEWRDQRPLLRAQSVGVDAYLEQLDVLRTLGVSSASSTPVLVRGERLALTRSLWTADDSEVETLYLVEVDEDGRLSASDMYGVDQIREAVVELDRRFLAGEGAPIAHVLGPVARWVRGIMERDWELLRSALHDDFVGYDHRPLGWGSVDAAGFVGLYRSAVELAADVWGGIFDIHEVSGQTICVRAGLRGTTSDGGAFMMTPTTAVAFVEGGRMARIEFFPGEEPERGLALLRRPRGAALENTATRNARARARGLLTEDWAAVSATYADDVVWQDHRPLLQRGLRGREDVEAESRSAIDAGTTDIELSVIATRGDRLCLTRVRFVNADADAELLAVALNEVDDQGCVVRLDLFDHEQINDAFDLLDERFLAGEGAGSPAWRATAALWSAANRRDWDRHRALRGDASEVVDDRPLSFGRMSPAEYTMSCQALVEQSPDVRWSMVRDLVTDMHSLLAVVHLVGTSEHGADFIRIVPLFIEERDGKVLWLEAFEAEPEARAAYEARFGVPVARAERPASIARRRILAALAQHDIDLVMDLYAPGAALTDHRPLVGGQRWSGDELRPVAQAMAEIGLTDAPNHDLAVRGERLDLARVSFEGSQANVEAIVLTETDGDDRILGIDLFAPEQRDEAYELLEERFLAGEATERSAWSTVVAAFEALNSCDLDRLRELVGEGFEARDHRPIGFGAIGGEAWIELHATLLEESADARWTVDRDLGQSGDLVCFSVVVNGTNRDGGPFRSAACLVGRLSDKGGEFLEYFETADEAVARFEELRDQGS